MTRRVRVLVVDDSVVVRRAVSQMFATDPQVKRFPQVAVLMFSALTEKGAMLTLDALSLGASDYVTKPASVGRHHVTLDEVREQLLDKTRALGARSAPANDVAPASRLRQSRVSDGPIASDRLSVVVLGASTGGPNAVSDVLASFAPRLRVPLLIVQHMPPVFTRIFAERLSQQHGLDVREATPGTHVLPGQCWVAPGDFHMVVLRDGDTVRLGTHQGPPENSCRPAVDTLFRSAATCYGAGTLGVVLTGMGQDGLRGCEDVRRAGGQVIVQDEATSVVWSMPGSVARAGLAQAVLPLAEIGAEILRRVGGERLGLLGPAAPGRSAP